MLLGVDRLDYTKGISQRLRAYQSLLDDGTLDTERCVMVQVATPTREGVEHYQDERREIEQLVSEINGVHGRLGYPAIHYLYQSLPLDELVALYRTGDVMLVTPLRDGMNLVAKEYVTTRLDGDGVLVLSEFAGAADELTDAVLVNPHDSGALRDAIVTAVEMNRHERRARMARLREVVRGSDVQTWAERFLADLTARPSDAVTRAADADDDPTAVAADAAALARPLLVGLDVDGVLAPIVAHADDADAAARACSRRSASWPPGPRSPSCPGARSTTSSGSASPTTSRCSGCTAWSAAASARSSWPTDERAAPRPPAGAGRRRRRRRPATGRGSRSSRPASCSTSARRSPEHGARSADELRERAADVTGAHVLPGKGVVELLTRATSKALAIAELRDELGAGGVVFVGDDRTDEEVFVMLGGGGCSIRVGPGATAARHRLAGPPEVLRFLQRLTELVESLTGSAPPAALTRSGDHGISDRRAGRGSSRPGYPALWRLT